MEEWTDLRERYREETGEEPPEETVALVIHESRERGRAVSALTPGDSLELRNDEPTLTLIGALPLPEGDE